MYITSNKYKEKIKEASRSFECKITIGDKIFNNEDIVDIKLETIQPSDGFTIGNTISKSLDLTLLNKGNTIYSTNQIKVEIGLKLDNGIEYILMGLFNIDDVEKTDYVIKFTAFDNMIRFETPYFSKLGSTATLQQIANELSTMTGVQFIGSLPAYNLKKLEGFTCREILGFIASLCGGNALITREGKFTIVTPKDIDYIIDTNNYFDYKREEVKYKISKISCQVEDKILSKGALGTDGMELQFENPWITETILSDVYTKLNGFNYIGYSMKWQGDLSLDIGDTITCTDAKGKVMKLPILSQKITYTGGLVMEMGAKGENKNKNSFSSNGNTNSKLNRVVTELLLVDEALINKANIKDLTATNIQVNNLKVQNSEIEKALIQKASIEQLEAINANINNLYAEDAIIRNAIIGKAEITDLNAAVGKITNLQSEVGKIETLVNGNLSSENIQAGGITSDKLTIANGFITNAMISNLDVSKINAGDISTNKFKIKSDDGGIEIVGATQQFKDKNNKVRIQMGQDSKGDFNFILRGEDGSTVLIDHTGIKEQAVADNLIKENMISANAVGEKAIDYNSFANGFNKDTNTNTLKATKIKLNNQNQSLEVAFNSLKSQADGTKSLTESHSTTIGVMQGQIITAINNTQIVKNGQTILLKDDYNRTVQTVDSMKSTIGSHTTQINETTGKITGVETKINTVERDLNGITQRVEKTEQIQQKNGVNLVPNSNMLKGPSGWRISPSNAKYTLGITGSKIPEDKRTITLGTPNDNTGNTTVYFDSPKFVVTEGGDITLSLFGAKGVNAIANAYLLFTDNTEDITSNNSYMSGYKSISFSNGSYTKKSITDKVPTGAKRAFVRLRVAKSEAATDNTQIHAIFSSIIVCNSKYPSRWVSAQEDGFLYTDNKVASIETTLNSITQRVASTESTTTNINSKLTTLEIWKREAEQKITDSSIINTVSSQFYKKSESDTIFANKTQLSQLDNKFEFKINTSGANNLIANSSFEGGFAEWELFNKPILSTNTEFLADRYGKMISIESGGGEGIFQRFPTIPGENYTVSFYAEADRQMPLSTTIGIEGKHLITLKYEPGFKRWSFTFTATSKIHTFIAYLGQAGKFYLGRVMVTQGTVLQEYREGLGIYSNIVSIDKSGLTVDSSNTNTRTITDSQGFRVQDKSTGENLLEANKKGVSAKGGRFYVDGPGGNYTLLWGRDININGGRAIVGTNATPEAPLKPKKMYINYNNDFTNGVEIGGKLTNNTFEVVSMKENQLGGQYIYRAMGDGLIYQCGYKEIKIRDGWIIEDVVNFPKPFPNYCTVFKAELELVDGNNYWTANYTLNSYRLDRLGGKVYGLNQKTYIAAQGAVARVFWWAIGA